MAARARGRGNYSGHAAKKASNFQGMCPNPMACESMGDEKVNKCTHVDGHGRETNYFLPCYAMWHGHECTNFAKGKCIRTHGIASSAEEKAQKVLFCKCHFGSGCYGLHNIVLNLVLGNKNFPSSKDEVKIFQNFCSENGKDEVKEKITKLTCSYHSNAEIKTMLKIYRQHFAEGSKIPTALYHNDDTFGLTVFRMEKAATTIQAMVRNYVALLKREHGTTPDQYQQVMSPHSANPSARAKNRLHRNIMAIEVDDDDEEVCFTQPANLEIQPPVTPPPSAFSFAAQPPPATMLAKARSRRPAAAAAEADAATPGTAAVADELVRHFSQVSC